MEMLLAENPVDGEMAAQPARLTVIVPIYNEARSLEANLAKIQTVLDGSDLAGSELILVDDGSVDDTAAIAEAFSRRVSWCRLIRHTKNQGIGAALRTGIDASRGTYVVVLDADLSYEAEIVQQLCDALSAQDAQMAIASPYMQGGRVVNVPGSRYVLSAAANQLLSLASGRRVRTMTGMVRGYRRSFLATVPWQGAENFNLSVALHALKTDARIAEIPATLTWPQERWSAGRMSKRRFLKEVRDVIGCGIALAFPGRL
jgi:dolichol-phosphate mannosyltransferase